MLGTLAGVVGQVALSAANPKLESKLMFLSVLPSIAILAATAPESKYQIGGYAGLVGVWGPSVGIAAADAIKYTAVDLPWSTFGQPAIKRFYSGLGRVPPTR